VVNGSVQRPCDSHPAIGATAAAFVIVGLWEDFLFRGVLIRELVVGFTSHKVSSPAATGSAVVVSALVFGAPHLNAGAAGLSASVVVVQAVIGGLYFGLAYVLTDSLALPVGIHFSTNFWTTIVSGNQRAGIQRRFDSPARSISVPTSPSSYFFRRPYSSRRLFCGFEQREGKFQKRHSRRSENIDIDFEQTVCMTDEQAALRSHLRSVRTALLAVAISVLTAGLVIAGEDGLGFPMFVLTLCICAYAFISPLFSRL